MSKQNKELKGIKKNSRANDLLFDKLEHWFINHAKILFKILLGLCVVFSFLLFNYRISEGNDDALYIESGYNYAHNFLHYYYTANAPFYPMFLGAVIALIGIKLFWLKLFSVLFNFFALFFFYKSFKGRMPYALLFPVLFTIAINSYFQYFASQTYTEAFFLFIEAVFFFYFFKLIDSLKEIEENKESSGKTSNWKIWLTVGFLSFFLTMTRNVAAVVVLAIIVYFLLQKKWKYASYGLLYYLIFKIPYEIIKFAIWGSINQYGSQSNILLRKDPYKGNSPDNIEDMMGFVTRFFDNCNAYLSRRFLQILGFISEKYTQNIAVFTFVILGFFIIGLIYAFRSKNNYLLYASLHTLFLAGATFFVLQQRWDQPRMIMIHVPVLLIMIVYGIHSLTRKSGLGQNILFALLLIIFSSSLISSMSKVSENLPILSKNLKGEKFYGYSADWKNFLQMSEWCADNLPDSALVASRKAPMSFVYGKGKKFFPVYTVIALDTATNYSKPDSVLAWFKKNKVTHVILASLRRDPAKADGNVINTLQRMMEPIAQKYPERLVLIHQIPAADAAQIEPCYLYEVK